MKVVFNGVLEKRSVSSGCKCRGKRTTTTSFVTSKSYILPSGKVQTFVKDRPIEVSDRDGRFLLSYSYVDANGVKQETFSEVLPTFDD